MILADVALVAFVASYLPGMASYVGDSKGFVDASCGQFPHNTGALGDPYPDNSLSLVKILHKKSAASAFASASTSAFAPYAYWVAYTSGIPFPFGDILSIQAFVALALVAYALGIPLTFDDILNKQALASALAYDDMLDIQAFVALALALALALASAEYIVVAAEAVE